MSSDEILVFDTGPLCHFALQNWLGVLKAVVGDRKAVIPDVVVNELRGWAANDSRIAAVLDAPWIEHRELRSPEDIANFGLFSGLLVKGSRNLGEAGVLALAKSTGATAVVDDTAGRNAGKRNNIAIRPTLALLCDGVRAGLLTIPLVSALADDLLASQYRLPFQSGEFATWAKEHGLLA